MTNSVGCVNCYASFKRSMIAMSVVGNGPGRPLDGFPAAQAGFSTGSRLTFSHLAIYPHYGRLDELFC